MKLIFDFPIRFLFYLLILAGINLLVLSARAQSETTLLEPVDLVEPLVDAANSRWFYFNSATLPFGMVNLSPDMIIDGAWNSGYRYNQDTIRAFSHVHAWQLSAIPVFPSTGPFQGHLGPDSYGSSYSHNKERAEPGYHQVFLDRYQIDVELTASTRVGMHRYTFPASAESHIQVDFSTFLGPCDTERALIRKVNDHEIEGYALMAGTRRRPKSTFIYYVIQLSKDADEILGWKDQNLIGPVERLSGAKTGVYFSFSTTAGEKVLMKVGVSYTSIENARLNLHSEIPHWNFDQVQQKARLTWNQWLSKIKVEGGTLEQRRRFYTDLWHALQGRRIISDVNGAYCDMTGSEPQIRQIPTDENGKSKFNHYNSDSFWGAQWTLNTLWHLVYPKLSEEFVQSMLMMYRDGGLIPRGPSGGNYTYVMTGASSTPFIVSAFQKGIRGFDQQLAYEGLKRNHLPGGLMSKAGYEHNTYVGGGLDFYLNQGFIPFPLPKSYGGFHEDGSGQTLEYAYQDWCLSEMAEALGKQNDAQYFRNRSLNYRNIWNESQGGMWTRSVEGDWQELDILEYGAGWVEGNAVQYNWWVPHDVAGLAELMGGRDSLVERLDDAFRQAEKHAFTSGKSHDVEVTRQNRRVTINYGNQPTIHTAFLFNYASAPWLTQYWSRRVIDAVYEGLSPQYGYSGDEDQGLMGSLAVLMKIGLFSIRGGCAEEPVYELSSPIFDRITLHLDPNYYSGEKIVIETKGNGPENYYIQSATLNGDPLTRPWIYHRDLVNNAHVVLRMGDRPNKNWGSDIAEAPPSLTTHVKQ